MTSEQAKQQLPAEGAAFVIHDCSPPSPSRFKSLVKNLRQKLHSEVAPPAHMIETDTTLQQTMEDVACLTRLLRISEANLVEERVLSNAAQTTVQELQHQLQTLSNDSIAHRDCAERLQLELDSAHQRILQLENDIGSLQGALCKSESYRKEYAKSKKSEFLEMQAKLEAAAAAAAEQDAAHQRTRTLLLSEVEARSTAVSTAQQLQASGAELQQQHQKLQELCISQEKQLQVRPVAQHASTPISLTPAHFPSPRCFTAVFAHVVR